MVHHLAVWEGFRIKPGCISTQAEFTRGKGVGGTPASALVAWVLVKAAQEHGSWFTFDRVSAKRFFLQTVSKKYGKEFFEAGFSWLVEARFVLSDGQQYKLSIRLVEGAHESYPAKPREEKRTSPIVSSSRR